LGLAKEVAPPTALWAFFGIMKPSGQLP
jgi:hypothetical protein